ncbi:MAG: hypothetical protein DRI90_14560 [Deltaproteobacteria bacterium]|nr:MAG: hypothetical protein DRI90_14560 [Deltaproteobacteria bacterium]
MLACLLATGCEPKVEGAEGPAETLSAYADALAAGRADDAYRLLSNEAKRSVSLEAFARMVTENPEDVRDIAQALARPGSAPVVRATVTAPSGDQLQLVYESGRWTIDGSGIDRYGQATPRQAIEGFLRAFDRQRFDVLMRYVPDSEREGRTDALWGPIGKPAGGEGTAEGRLDGDLPKASAAAADGGALTAAKLKEAWTGDQKEYISSIVQAIRSALTTARIEETEDRAAMPYGAGGTVLFVRENGLWKIEDLK